MHNLKATILKTALLAFLFGSQGFAGESSPETPPIAERAEQFCRAVAHHKPAETTAHLEDWANIAAAVSDEVVPPLLVGSLIPSVIGACIEFAKFSCGYNLPHRTPICSSQHALEIIMMSSIGSLVVLVTSSAYLVIPAIRHAVKSGVLGVGRCLLPRSLPPSQEVLSRLICDAQALAKESTELKALPVDSRRALFASASRLGQLPLMRALLTDAESEVRRKLDTYETCPICFEAFDGSQDSSSELVMTTCKHGFHKKCLTPWLKEHETCPSCRSANSSTKPLSDVWPPAPKPSQVVEAP